MEAGQDKAQNPNRGAWRHWVALDCTLPDNIHRLAILSLHGMTGLPRKTTMLVIPVAFLDIYLYPISSKAVTIIP